MRIVALLQIKLLFIRHAAVNDLHVFDKYGLLARTSVDALHYLNKLDNREKYDVLIWVFKR